MRERDWQAADSGPPSGCSASARDQVLAKKLTVDECGSCASPSVSATVWS